MLIKDGVDLTNPVQSVLKKPDNKGLRVEEPEKAGEVKKDKPVDLASSGVFHFPQPE
jgi:hypothetical protein